MRRTPDATAVVFGAARLSYAELNAKANQLAHYLRTQGVGPDVMVGIGVERGHDMVIGLLGILKAGGACLPLDPDYPAARLAYMLEDASPAIVLTQQPLRANLPGGRLTFCLDSQWAELEAFSTSDPRNQTHAANLAYVIYTSGSTGKPKGVGVQVSTLVNLLTWQLARQPRSDKVLQFASLNFDVSFQEIFSTLCAGDTLLMIDTALRQDLQHLHQYVVDAGCRRMFLPNAVLQHLAGLPAAGGAPSTPGCDIVTAGEQLVVSDALRRYVSGLKGTTLTNQYGPSETHVVTQFELACADMESWPQLPPIGRPIANTRIYILDRHLQPVPIGVAGELHIAGVSLARGYLNRPDLTADRFIPDPFSIEPGSRMYKSGDLARYLPDGQIDYLGRIDQQIKIRGFRIEPGEVEAALASLPGVSDAVVLVLDGRAGDKRLVAYIAGTDGAGGTLPDDARLRAALAQLLPDYMVPAHFVVLERFPLTSNGKVDRKALPAPDLSHSQVAHAAPTTAVEVAVAAIWAEVLTVERVGLHDNFFSLGGHSLLATQVVSRTRERFKVDLPLRALFESPTVHAIAALITGTDRDAAASRIPRADRGKALPLSFAQQRLWVLDQFTAGTASYNVPVALTLRGRVDIQALQRTLDEVVMRHEALRTTFPSEDGTPVQRIAAAMALPLAHIDLRDLPRAERGARAAWLAQDMAQAPFDLACGPLIRAAIVRMDDDEHRFMLTMHHIVSDGWSVGVLVGEVAALYGAHVQGLPSPLAPLAIQYADFAQWQRNWLRGPVLEAQRSYWRDYLSGAPTMLTLPTDRPRPPVQTYRGAVHDFQLPASVATGLQALCRKTGTTLFMSLAAAFNIMLSRYSGQDDICLGTPIANRHRTDIEPLIGFFVNTLVLRTRIDRSMRFSELLEGVRTDALAAYARQDLPFEYLVDALQPERQSSHSPLFQVMLVVQNAPLGELDLPGLELEPMRADTASAKFDLTLGVGGEGDTLSASMEYNTDLFDASSIARMSVHFTRLLESIVADPDARIGDLDMLPQAERQLLLHGWNASEAQYPRGQSIHRLIEAQVARTPERTAVVFQGRSLSYAQLNARANRLAHRLQSLGVAPDMLVGLCVERSLEMIVGLLAVLKTGAAYVPLDPGYPAQRLAYMLEDACPAVLLTQSHLPMARQALGVPVECIDRDDFARYPDANLAVQPEAGNLVYVIYTSGSTGKPKGTAVHQGGLLNLVCWFVNQFGIDSADKVLLFSSFSFDLTQKNIYSALMTGGELHLPAEGYDPEGTAAIIREQEITCLNCAPSAFYPLLAHGPLPLRHVFLGGEPIRAELLIKAFGDQACPPTIHNTYGPTEASDVVSFHSWDMRQGGTPIPIGRPIANTQLYILDQDMQPVPPGAAGELHVGGDGVGRGYRQRPALTAEKFVPDPFGTRPGARLYKTGDLARQLADGSIEYLGRIDHQVKLRGFRIELGEIEAALAAIDGVDEVLVMLREDSPGDKRLAAYLCGPAVPDAATLRSALLHSLPDYMVPANIITLDQLPLTPNGKVDRSALPAPDAAPAPHHHHVAPQGELEAGIAHIWQQVLGIERVGRHDNFFELGGHSLLAVSMLARLRRALQVDLAVRALLTNPTVSQFAAAIGQRQARSTGSANLVALRPLGTVTPLFCVHPGEGEAGYVRNLLPFIDQRQPVYGIAAQGFLPGEPALDSVEEMARRYVEAIRTVQPEGPYRLAGWSAGGTIAYEMARQLRQVGQRIDYLGLIDTTSDYAGSALGQVAADETSFLMGHVPDNLASELHAELTTLAGARDTDALLSRFQQLAWLPGDVDLPGLRRHLAVRRGIAQALATYTAQPLDVPAHLYCAGLNKWGDLAAGWRTLLGQALTTASFAADHYSIVAMPQVAALGLAMQAAMSALDMEADR